MKNQFMAMKVNPYIILGKKYRTNRNKWMSFSIFLLFLDFLLSLLLIIFDYISFKDDVKVQKKKYLIIEVSISAGICVILFILMLIKIYLIELICISLYIVAGASYWAYLLVKAIILAINPEQGQKERKADFFENEKEFSMIIFLVLIGLLRVGVCLSIQRYINNIKKLKGFSDQKSTEKLINTIEKKIDSGSFLSWNESLNKL